MEQVANFCKALEQQFGKVYEGATLETINGVLTPVYFDGVEYINLHPKDTDCKFTYVRELQAVQINTRDFGGCNPAYEALYRLRVVFFDPNNFNNFDQLRRFTIAISGYRVTITNMVNNIETLYRQESGGSKYVRAKRYGYMAIDFDLRVPVDTCDIHNC
jgi:hypothetical protein